MEDERVNECNELQEEAGPYSTYTILHPNELRRIGNDEEMEKKKDGIYGLRNGIDRESMYGTSLMIAWDRRTSIHCAARFLNMYEVVGK